MSTTMLQNIIVIIVFAILIGGFFLTGSGSPQKPGDSKDKNQSK